LAETWLTGQASHLTQIGVGHKIGVSTRRKKENAKSGSLGGQTEKQTVCEEKKKARRRRKKAEKESNARTDARSKGRSRFKRDEETAAGKKRPYIDMFGGKQQKQKIISMSKKKKKIKKGGGGNRRKSSGRNEQCPFPVEKNISRRPLSHATRWANGMGKNKPTPSLQEWARL